MGPAISGILVLGRGILSTVPGGDAILSTVEARQRLFGSLVSPTEPWALTAARLLGLAPPVPPLAAARGRRRVTSVVRQRFTGSVTRSSEATRLSIHRLGNTRF